MNCKPGDHAHIIVGDGHFKPEPQNVGRIVRCIEVQSHPRTPGSPVWTIEAVDGPLHVVADDTGRTMPGSVCYMEDANLRPIRPETRTREALLSQSSE